MTHWCACMHCFVIGSMAKILWLLLGLLQFSILFSFCNYAIVLNYLSKGKKKEKKKEVEPWDKYSCWWAKLRQIFPQWRHQIFFFHQVGKMRWGEIQKFAEMAEFSHIFFLLEKVGAEPPRGANAPMPPLMPPLLFPFLPLKRCRWPWSYLLMLR